MKHYTITTELRRELNDFLGAECIKREDVGREMYDIKSYEVIARTSPNKAKLLMATLFPETLNDFGYLSTHKAEITSLAKRLHIEDISTKPGWSAFVVRREASLPELEGKRDEDILRGNIVRFR